MKLWCNGQIYGQVRVFLRFQLYFQSRHPDADQNKHAQCTPNKRTNKLQPLSNSTSWISKLAGIPSEVAMMGMQGFGPLLRPKINRQQLFVPRRKTLAKLKKNDVF